MKPTTNLKLPKKDRPKGLFLYCNACKTYYADHSKVSCKCRQLVYKALIHVSGTKNARKSQVFSKLDFNEVLNEFYIFKKQLMDNNFQKIEIVKKQNKPERLIECFAYYMGFLHNVNVPQHKQKERDPKYIAKVDNAFDMVKSAFILNNVDWKILRFTDLSDELVGYIHEYFLKVKVYANKTYNNNMAILSAFTSHIISEFNVPIKNPFLGVPDLIVIPKVKSLRQNEFEQLLEIISPENGKTYKARKGRKNPVMDNLYKPWLKNAFKLGLFTGGRSEDIVELKWNGITLDEHGNFYTIKSIDYKIDKANNNRTGKDEHYEKFFAITSELGSLLNELGYEQYKNSDKYIIAPEDGLKRSHIAVLISRAFSHYYKQLNTGKVVTFKNLRKTFMTSALREFGEASTALTNHTNISMTNKHYYDKDVTRNEARSNFSVFKPK